jgi:hypothetical protein
VYVAAPSGPTWPPCFATIVNQEKVIIHMHYYTPPHTLLVPSMVFLSLFKGVVIDSQDQSNHKIKLGL